MRVTIYITAILLSLVFVMQGAVGQSQERKVWLAERREMIARAKTVSDEQTILDLSRIIRGVGSDLPNASEEAKQLYAEALDLIKAIPGHAEYYRDKILQAQERVKTLGVSSKHEYRSELMYGFQTLPHLSSPEGVRVLGELLSNDWVPPGNETAPQSGKFVPLSISSTVTLQRFPLLDKPFKDPITESNVADANAAWLLWFEQVKSGNRTFRFEGDPTEYDLSGPAPKQKIERVERDRKRNEERKTAHKKGSGTDSERPDLTTTPEPGNSNVPLVAGTLFVMIAVGYFILRKRISGAS
jgi:hypothetical protein